MINKFLSSSMRSAYQRWQSLELKMEEGRRELEKDFLVLRTTAQKAGVNAPVGILKMAQDMMEIKIPKSILRMHNRIQNAFDIRGTSFLRRAPLSLGELLDKYTSLIDEICKSYEKMGQRIKIAIIVLDFLNKSPQFNAASSPHFVLISPEVAETLLELKRRQWTNQQVIARRLKKGLNNRLQIGWQWLNLLQKKMSLAVYRRNFRELEILKQAAQNDQKDIDNWLSLHRQISSKLNLLNRLSVRSFSKSQL